MNTPEFVNKIIPESDWNSWTNSQKDFILKNHNNKIQPESLKTLKLHADYSDKTWELDKIRPETREFCDQCNFEFCFYAVPRNWSMGSDSDVWNLMRCANVNCGHYFESCL